MKEVYSIQEAWLAKLGQWDESLRLYNIRLSKNPRDKEAIAGKLKCLDYLGRWEEAISLCNESLEHMRLDINASATATTVLTTSTDGDSNKLRSVSPVTISRPLAEKRPVSRLTRSLSPSLLSPASPTTTKELINSDADRDRVLFTKSAVIGARSAWSLNKWGLMRQFVSQLPDDNVDSCFLRAVIASHDEDYVISSNYIEQTRRYLDGNIAALLAESYGRAYHQLIMVQQCAEFEEMIDFKLQMKEIGLELGNPDSAGLDELDDLDLGSGFGASITRSIPHKHASLRLCDVNSTPDQNKKDSATPFGKLPARTLPANPEDCDSEQLAQWTAQQQAKRLKSSLVDKWRRRIKGCSSDGRAAIPFWKVIQCDYFAVWCPV
jgi:tetratricopeptide (TPR) repeat protein